MPGEGNWISGDLARASGNCARSSFFLAHDRVALPVSTLSDPDPSPGPPRGNSRDVPFDGPNKDVLTFVVPPESKSLILFSELLLKRKIRTNGAQEGWCFWQGLSSH